MARWNVGPKNPIWKGGRTVTSHGYVLILVGTNHHLADSRGYAYEHRIVAEEILGRRLKPGEQVHHKDSDKENNKKSNLEIMGSLAEHRKAHRTKERGLRNPGERNPMIKCACGCGEKFRKYDSSNRQRKYLSGHNLRPSPTMDAIYELLRAGPLDRLSISKKTKIPAHSISAALSKMQNRELVHRVGHGIWERI